MEYFILTQVLHQDRIRVINQISFFTTWLPLLLSVSKRYFYWSFFKKRKFLVFDKKCPLSSTLWDPLGVTIKWLWFETRMSLSIVNSLRLLDVEYNLHNYGVRSFSVASPKLWNALLWNLDPSVI